ncbi:Hypothetical_protein [Hexamita inflata]|uniref:Hypothetical_protein n=1 Tax=Hexamita inflata TaxID=28002 RepID=A0ABP1HT57_9EUKA
MIAQQAVQLVQQIQEVNQSLQSHVYNTTLSFNIAQINIQKVNNSLNQQLQQQSAQLLQTIIVVNTSLKQQLDVQKQQIISTNQTMYDMKNAQAAYVNSVNYNLQNQIDSTKNDVRNVQSSISGINGLINNIHNINAVQNADIQALKSQSGQDTQQMIDGAFWCSIAKTLNTISSFNLNIQGYCANLQLCCWNQPYTQNIKQCIYWGQGNNKSILSSFSDANCGTFVYI